MYRSMHLTSWSGVCVDQRCDGRVAAQLVQEAAAVRADAADRDAQPGADLCIRHRRALGEHGEQPLATGGQVRERLAQGRLVIGLEQFLLGCLGVMVRDGRGV
jgi:hypothetical protein